MTVQIADLMEKVLQPNGVAVVLEAEHSCMCIRGVRKPGATTITTRLARNLQGQPGKPRGSLLADPARLIIG